MHDTIVKMKDGREFIGPLWYFRPKEGWISLVLDPAHYDHDIPERIYLRDVESAITKGERISINKIGDEDELERAKQKGWDGR